MATWKLENVVMTSIGLDILNRIKVGIGKITVTKIEVGSLRTDPISLPDETSIRGTTYRATISEVVPMEGGSEIATYITNKGVSQPFTINQIGVYVTHPDYSGDQLYLIAQCEEVDPDVLPPESESAVNYGYSLFLEHGNASSAVINVDYSGMTLRSTFEALKTDFLKFKGETIRAIKDIRDIIRGNSDSISAINEKNVEYDLKFQKIGTELSGTLKNVPGSVSASNLTDGSVFRAKLGRDVYFIKHLSLASKPGEWSYAILNGGLYICWLKNTFQANIKDHWGSLWCSTYGSLPNYPYSFKDTPSEFASVHRIGSGLPNLLENDVIVSPAGSSTRLSPSEYRIVSPVQTNVSVNIDIFAIGTILEMPPDENSVKE